MRGRDGLEQDFEQLPVFCVLNTLRDSPMSPCAPLLRSVRPRAVGSRRLQFPAVYQRRSREQGQDGAARHCVPLLEAQWLSGISVSFAFKRPPAQSLDPHPLYTFPSMSSHYRARLHIAKHGRTGSQKELQREVDAEPLAYE